MGKHTYHLTPRQRYRIVADHLKGHSPTTLCRFYGIPRKTFYYWLAVWQRDPDHFVENVALTDHTPKRQPRLTDEKTRDLIIRLRKRSKYGPERLKLLLAERGVTRSSAGIAKVLKRAGLIKKHRRKIKKKYKKFSAFIKRPGERVQVDVAYLPHLFGKTHRQYVYQAIDLHTRMATSVIYPECTPTNTVDFLKRTMGFFPFTVEKFQFDNGTEFTYDLRPDIQKEHPVQVFLRSRRIEYCYSPVATPRMNGCVERLHRTWRQEVERWHHWVSPAKMHRDNNKWLLYYNEQRPHFGIKAMTPIEKLQAFDAKYDNIKLDYSRCYFTV
jgi:transposase InsO family protein